MSLKSQPVYAVLADAERVEPPNFDRLALPKAIY